MQLGKSATRTRFQLTPDRVRGLEEVAVCTATRCRWRNEVMAVRQRRCSATHRADAINPRRCRGLTEYVTASAVIRPAWCGVVGAQKNSRHDLLVAAVMLICPRAYFLAGVVAGVAGASLRLSFALTKGVTSLAVGFL